MLKKIVLLICFFAGCQKIFSQELEGEWKGSFTDNKPVVFIVGSEMEISFVFSKLNDTTYQAYSKTTVYHGKEKDSSVCILQGGFIKDNLLVLTETRSLTKFKGQTTDECLQTMELSYYKRKKRLVLEGSWETKDNKCGYGTISLIKRLPKK